MTLKVGVLGGGQLGRMMAMESPRFACDLSFLDKGLDFPAAKVSSNFVQGDFTKTEDVVNFGKDKDVVTIEIENVSVEGLEKLEELGIRVFPQSNVIRTIKDKGLQKQFYFNNSIPTSKFLLFEDADDIRAGVENGSLQLPFVQKLRTEGYDGRGVQIINSQEKLENVFDAPSVIEKLVDIEKEIAVIVARSLDGVVVCYPVVEMVFEEEANLLDYLICPATISKERAKEATDLAIKVANDLSIVGLLAVEMFLDNEGQILVNESAPRAHNSGHHTLDNSSCSQFEQLLRAVCNFPLAIPTMHSPAIMVNLLGEELKKGPVIYKGLNELLADPKVHPHLYGKQITKPYRKMGHVTILDQDLENAIKKANFVKETLKATTNG